MNRIALWVADIMLEYAGRGTHTYVYASRINDIRAELFEIRRLYFGVKASGVTRPATTSTGE